MTIERLTIDSMSQREAELGAADQIVITGVGVITSAGIGLDHLRELPPSSSSANNRDVLAARFEGKVEDFGSMPTSTKRRLRKSLKLMNRETQLGVAAAQHAIEDASLAFANYPPERVGVCFGAGNVEISPDDFVEGVEACGAEDLGLIKELWGQTGIPKVEPLWILRVLPNMPACHIAILRDYRGPNNTITQAEASANLAISEARRHILDGNTDSMIVGGCGTTIHSDSSGARDVDGQRCCSEGAGAFVLERASEALRRKAKIYGVLSGHGSSCVIDTTHVPKPHAATSNAIRATLRSASCQASDVDSVYIDSPSPNTWIHGTEWSTSIFGEHRPVKRMFADNLGSIDAAAGAIGLASALASFSEHDCDSIVLSVNTTATGLASCLSVRSPFCMRAA